MFSPVLCLDFINSNNGFVSFLDMDRISGLSDELLLKILLLVPTKVAVSTSVLSKRWEHLWMWLPKLEYGRKDCLESEAKRLQCFINRNLPLHRAPVLESFRLEYLNSRFKPKNIKMWVLAALSHCLRELEISYHSYPSKPNILPSNLYTSKSLVILILRGDILLDVPRMVSLPSLKTLKLKKVRYINNDETLQRLLSSCPILEDLVLSIGDKKTTGKLTVSVPSLQNLSFSIPSSNDIDGFVIETPNLKYFKLRCHSYDDDCCLIENMPYLIEANLDVNLHFLNSFLGSSTSLKGLIGSITSVKRLAICSQTMLDEGFVFNQLEHLDLCLCTLLFPDQLVQLLNASSKLKRLDIVSLPGHAPHQDIDDWNQPSTVPECLSSSLQSFNWSSYSGKPQEREIVVYILKHALHLKTANVKSSKSLAVRKHEMLKELALSSRASTTCQLMFE